MGTDPEIPIHPSSFLPYGLNIDVDSEGFWKLHEKERHFVSKSYRDWRKLVKNYNDRTVFQFLLNSVMADTKMVRVVATKEEYERDYLEAYHEFDWEGFKEDFFGMVESYDHETDYTLVDAGTDDERLESEVTLWNVVCSDFIVEMHEPQVLYYVSGTGRTLRPSPHDQITREEAWNLAEDAGVKLMKF